MVDQKVNDEKINRNILSLPNLETKFVAANTLIPIDKPQQLLLKDPEVERYENILREIHHKIFYTRGYAEKKKLKKEELDTRKHLRKLYIEKAGYKKEAAEAITKWNPFDPLKAAPFFDPGIMFTISGKSQQGWFNIMIGNPPYIQLQKDRGKLASQLREVKFETFSSTGDIYTLFYEKGFQLLLPNGVHVFITSSQWTKAAYGKLLRKYLLKHNPVKILFLGPGIFENTTVDTNILISEKRLNRKILKGIELTSSEQIKNFEALEFINMKNISEEDWKVSMPLQDTIQNKVKLSGKQLKEWKISINRGILTGFNEAFIINQEKRDELISSDPAAAQIIKPILRGRKIGKYSTKWEGDYLINTHNGIKVHSTKRINVENFPTVYQYLLGFYNELNKRADQGDTPFNLRNCAYLNEFSKEKIIWKRIGSSLRFSFSDSEIYSLDSTCLATGEKIKYLTGVLNSKLYCFYLNKNAPRTGMGDLIISVQAIESLYVHYPTEKEEKINVSLFNEILRIRNKSPEADTLLYENRIDLIVYRMNNLVYEECKIIDPQIEKLITREDYERMSIEELSEYEIKV